MITLLAWLALATISLPLALAGLVLYPIVWVVGLPLRLAGISVQAVLGLVTALAQLPARALGVGSRLAD